MIRNMHLLLISVFLAISILLGGCNSISTVKKANPEEYPARQIKLIVPFGAGGEVDAQARALKKVAVKYLHQPLLVMNKSGGGGNIALYELAKSKPDGYTLGLSCPEVIFHSVYGSAKHHYLTDLEPIVQISSAPFFLVVNASSPWKNVDDLIQYGKSTPLKFSHSGIGSASHVAGEIFSKLSHIKTLQVPFKEISEKVSMLLGNHVDATFISPGPVKELIKAGKLKVLASTGSKRLEDPLFTNVPTFKELGMNIEFTDWFGIASAKSLPPETKAKLAAALKEMILDPEVKDSLNMINAQVDYLGPKESQEKWIFEAKKLKKMVTETGVLEQIKQQQGVKF